MWLGVGGYIDGSVPRQGLRSSSTSIHTQSRQDLPSTTTHTQPTPQHSNHELHPLRQELDLQQGARPLRPGPEGDQQAVSSIPKFLPPPYPAALLLHSLANTYHYTSTGSPKTPTCAPPRASAQRAMLSRTALMSIATRGPRMRTSIPSSIMCRW
jgi:hypothetical protein